MFEAQDLRVVKTLDNIKNSFLQLIKEKSFTKITIKDLTERARINRSTFYKYYLDKYDLKEKVINNFLKDYKNEFSLTYIKSINNSIILNIDELEKLMLYFQIKEEIIMTLWNQNMEDCVLAKMQEILEEKVGRWIKLNTDTEQLDKKDELFIRIFSSSFLVIIKWWFECVPNYSAREIAQLVCDSRDLAHEKFLSDNR
ncbi:TetR/AcrR family transcriptional regulator [Clostridium botulinum]|uniref:TetR/AcrR family transcriptional regulator n=1 Tax=Clostridium botulinum TaxID=1491 RepID=A0A6B4TKS3_CLOBO|nr:TetR/AcrR family transcriptional regulator [Clostridium botulinum]NFD85785.1 TetR/AcrR family transcriptional regulator [Clostridium botulinum]NFE07262.1 TetR/AcrR family transcriptional regulator [Clostridium botulinum]NFE35443.1 TetR/AcrR family transcriptional regulator [Clostridium botulinum]NFE49712.1 TetR/AcrR family transcriptional regulator [Clostridium botulinum]